MDAHDLEQVKSYMEFQKELELVRQDINYLRRDLLHLDETVNKSNQIFALKWVEKVLWSAGGIVATAILVAVLNLVIL